MVRSRGLCPSALRSVECAARLADRRYRRDSSANCKLRPGWQCPPCVRQLPRKRPRPGHRHVSVQCPHGEIRLPAAARPPRRRRNEHSESVHPHAFQTTRKVEPVSVTDPDEGQPAQGHGGSSAPPTGGFVPPALLYPVL